ncbi:MAG: hypothetical protein E7229_00525 [Clostridiales bacterium]|nr:hypothetical protein [Clostridiales bacterium]
MPRHEFGMMPFAPQYGKRYDKYEPQKYSCISIEDEYMERIAAELQSVDFYWHTLSVKGKGLAYYGITLIPPSSLKAFIKLTGKEPVLSELTELLEKALDENKWVIHFGI